MTRETLNALKLGLTLFVAFFAGKFLGKGADALTVDELFFTSIAAIAGALGYWVATNPVEDEPYNPWDKDGGLKQ